ncbi:conjugative transposon protein TraM [Chryseobacterium sp. ISL-6]|uniref:conjugative transposon protein TraM n=1 Tax=Chryseobacterium sp. ISL-6 TaxID=2819143 RepID=UPI001BEB16BA|nr:conjugative transposon protein TraM [Chryseobacterium sp. ISL-6]MBT2623587.1 conjugative transposon protein TraM [Chryseobacterium sp. ISL-6]
MKDLSKTTIRITEGNSPDPDDQEGVTQQFEKLKKPLIYLLMGIVCAGCLYLIFKPNKNLAITGNSGFNTAVPQAANDQLQPDKQKAYEQDLLEQKNEEKRKALTSLSDYWNDPDHSTDLKNQTLHPDVAENSKINMVTGRNAFNSYQTAQQTLGSFYKRDNQEIDQLKQEISRLKHGSMQKDLIPVSSGINDQLELMEKSYQMAAKYLPLPKNEDPDNNEIQKKETDHNKAEIASIKPICNDIVSGLYRYPSDSMLLAGPDHNRFTGIQNVNPQGFERKNSIRAVIHETQVMTPESILSLRLLEPMMIGNSRIPSGTLLKATGKFQGARLELKISAIEYDGSIQPVDITIHDNDGQSGLYIPYSPEQNAITDMLANMSQSSGTNIMMTQSAGQQIAADLTKGLVQGVSGYFRKRVKSPKVTVKAGHQVFLISKNS